MIIPPIVGIDRLCNLRSSSGVSVRFFNSATLISDGVKNITTKNEVKNASIVNPMFFLASKFVKRIYTLKIVVFIDD